VSRTFAQGEQQVRALDDVSLVLHAGEFVALAGPSGSGKTTLLNVAGGLDRPDSGRVLVAGQDLGSLSAEDLARLRLERLAYIFQGYNLVPVLTAEENAEFILLLRGVPQPARRASVKRSSPGSGWPAWSAAARPSSPAASSSASPSPGPSWPSRRWCWPTSRRRTSTPPRRRRCST
jgi:ABC-type methionine transport system ATPase subunit